MNLPGPFPAGTPVVDDGARPTSRALSNWFGQLWAWAVGEEADRIAADALKVDISTGLTGTKIYYVSDSSGGAVTRKLTFVNGILVSET